MRLMTTIGRSNCGWLLMLVVVVVIYYPEIRCEQLARPFLLANNGSRVGVRLYEWKKKKSNSKQKELKKKDRQNE